jgi:hypothetical protein
VVEILVNKLRIVLNEGRYTLFLYGISGSHGVEYEDESLLGYSALTTEAVRTTETSVYSSDTIRR